MLCCHIGLLFGKRRHDFATSLDSKISRFTHPHVIRFIVDLFFPLWRADLEAYVEFARYVWMEAVSRKKKLQIQKYLDINCANKCQ